MTPPDSLSGGAILSRTHPQHGYTPCVGAQAPPLLGPRSRKPFPQIKIYHYTPVCHGACLLDCHWSGMGGAGARETSCPIFAFRQGRRAHTHTRGCSVGLLQGRGAAQRCSLTWRRGRSLAGSPAVNGKHSANVRACVCVCVCVCVLHFRLLYGAYGMRSSTG